ncbi:MAG: hypothetical protein H6729_05795 [Deltaproteobacteria bacterium]|nr:hypothetical protein [Deltaproteobacteria bacterium]
MTSSSAPNESLDASFNACLNTCLNTRLNASTRVRARATTALSLSLAILQGVCIVGCSGAQNDDAFTFVSTAEDGSDVLLDQPIAVGASLDITARLKGTTSSGGRVQVDAASFQPAGIFTIDTVANPIVIRALQPGQATLQVVNNADQRGTVVLHASSPASINLVGSMVIDSIETPLETQIVAQGIVLHPSVSLSLDVELYDASEARLLGYGAAQWSTSAREVLTLERPVVPTSNRVRCVIGEQAGTVTVSSGLGPEIEIEVMNERPSAQSLRLFATRTFLTDPLPAEIAPPITLPTGRTRTLAVLGFDEHERAIAASFADALTASAPAGFETTLAFLPNHHLLSMSGLSAGEVDIDLMWLGASRTLRVIVED